MKKYYLFLRTEKEISEYKKEFDRVFSAIETGKTPVQNELRWANTLLFEAFPYQSISAVFLIVGTLFLNKIEVNELLKIGIVLIINNLSYAIGNYLFTVIKHALRIRLCRKMGISATERNIAVMESMEYQSV